MAKNPSIPSRETLKRTLENSGSDFPLDELEAIYAEIARQFEEDATLPVVESQRWLSPYHHMVESFLADVHAAMKREGVSASELARRLGVSRAWVSKALSGDVKNFQLATVAKLACALNLGVSLVLEEPNVVEPAGEGRLASVLEALEASRSARRDSDNFLFTAAIVPIHGPRVADWASGPVKDDPRDEAVAYG